MVSRKKGQNTLFCLIFLTIGLASSAPDGGHGMEWIHASQQAIVKRGGDSRELRYCGLRLFEAIRSLCGGNYAGLSRRSDPALASNGGGYYEDIIDFHEQNKNSISSSMNNGEIPQATSQDFESESWDSEDNSVTDVDFMWPKNSKNIGLKILTENPSSYHRIRRSVTEECCKKACGARTLLKYCGSIRHH